MTRLRLVWDLGCLVNYNINDISPYILREVHQRNSGMQQKSTGQDSSIKTNKATLNEVNLFALTFATLKTLFISEGALFEVKWEFWSSICMSSHLLWVVSPSEISRLLQKFHLETAGLLSWLSKESAKKYRNITLFLYSFFNSTNIYIERYFMPIYDVILFNLEIINIINISINIELVPQ